MISYNKKDSYVYTEKEPNDEILGAVDVFNFEIYNRDGLFYKTDTAKSFKINSENDTNTLEIVDALINYDFVSRISKARKADRELRIRGYTLARSPETNKDVVVRISISFAELVNYEVSGDGSVQSPKLTFTFPSLDAHGFDNLDITLEK